VIVGGQILDHLSEPVAGVGEAHLMPIQLLLHVSALLLRHDSGILLKDLVLEALACGEEPGLQLEHLRAIAINHH
jgi:hypothetical protein